MAWCVHTQASPLSDAALSAVCNHGGYVPPQFWFEVLHSLARSERRGIVQRAAIDEFLVDLSEMQLLVAPAYNATEMIDLNRQARHYTLKIYDAAYLDLALRLDLPLATRDAALARAAEKAGAKLFTA